ncbi:MAG: hypothetical protein H7A35_03235 [Planctomycetales bacterium]|nr:hypothetical protein [bacterium]UNM09069.1 MAG: hypothetical protein H7A35_03235 [Planctomycetales bacterium]
MNRTVWILAAFVLLAGLLGLLLPPLMTRGAVRSAVLQIGDAVRSEDMNRLEAGIIPVQRGMARSLIEPLLKGHGSSLQRTRITGMEKHGDGSYTLEVVFSFDDPSWGRQVVEARMPMQYDTGQWLLDLAACEARQFSISGDGSWTKAVDWLNLAHP